MSKQDQSLAEAIAAAARNAFSEWRKTHQDETVFAFALSTIDDALYVSAAVNTEESHRRTLEKNQVQMDSPDAHYYKWAPNEWEYEFIAPPHFKGVDGQIKVIYNRMHETEFGSFRKRVREAMVQALVLLRVENAIPATGGAAPSVFFATVYDSSDAEDLQLRSAQAANPVECISEFVASFRN